MSAARQIVRLDTRTELKRLFDDLITTSEAEHVGYILAVDEDDLTAREQAAFRARQAMKDHLLEQGITSRDLARAGWVL